MPDTAIEVQTTGTPSWCAELTLPLTPAPQRSGATERRIREKSGRSCGT